MPPSSVVAALGQSQLLSCLHVTCRALIPSIQDPSSTAMSSCRGPTYCLEQMRLGVCIWVVVHVLRQLYCPVPPSRTCRPPPLFIHRKAACQKAIKGYLAATLHMLSATSSLAQCTQRCKPTLHAAELRVAIGTQVPSCISLCASPDLMKAFT